MISPTKPINWCVPALPQPSTQRSQPGVGGPGMAHNSTAAARFWLGERR